MKAFFSKKKQQEEPVVPIQPEKVLSQLSLDEQDLDKVVSEGIPDSYEEISIDEDELLSHGEPFDVNQSIQEQSAEEFHPQKSETDKVEIQEENLQKSEEKS